MPAPITLAYAGVLGLLMAILSIRVPMRRGALDVPWGDGGDETLAVRIRVFGNFIEYVPAIVLLLFLLETSGVEPWALHALGGALIAARLTHAFWLRARSDLTMPEKIGRALGAILTWLVLTVAAVCALVVALSA
ncbi:MAG: MAPEG family protein [Myxococcota bacterium]